MEVGSFDALPPDPGRLRHAARLGAIDENNQLTPLGAQLARLPIDPRIARMILAAREEGVLDEVLIIAALSAQDPRERPMDMQQAADEAHGKFKDENSDFLAYLHLWRWHEEKRHQLGTSALRRACKTSFLSFVRMREWREIHHQLKDLVGELPPTDAPPSPAARRPPPPRPPSQTHPKTHPRPPRPAAAARDGAAPASRPKTPRTPANTPQHIAPKNLTRATRPPHDTTPPTIRATPPRSRTTAPRDRAITPRDRAAPPWNGRIIPRNPAVIPRDGNAPPKNGAAIPRNAGARHGTARPFP